jgi:hypothetical protein
MLHVINYEKTIYIFSNLVINLSNQFIVKYPYDVGTLSNKYMDIFSEKLIIAQILTLQKIFVE